MPKHKTKGPLTLQGAAVAKQALRSDVSVSLQVVSRDSAAAGRGLSALVHPSTLQQLLQQDEPMTATGAAEGVQLPSSCFLQLASGSDCVLHTRPSHDLPPGCIQVDEVQQANLRLCPAETYSFSVFVPGGSQPGAGVAGDMDVSSDDESSDDSVDMTPAEADPTAAAAAAAGDDSLAPEESEEDAMQQQQQAGVTFELTDVDVEVRLLPGASSSSSSSSDGPVQVDGHALQQSFSKQCFGRVLAVNEYVVVDLPGCPPLLLRVSATNTLTAEEQQDVLGYHCFRGLLTPDTEVYFTALAAAAPTPCSNGSSSSSSMDSAQHVQQQQHVAGTAQQLSALTLQTQADSASSMAQSSQVQATSGAQQAGHEHSQALGHNTESLQSQQQQQQHSPQQQQAQQSQQAPVQSRLAAGGGSIQLLHARQRPPAAAPTNIVNIYTSDGEWFPVKKRLLRPCIALTKAVRDSGDTAPTVTVAIDTLTFDRVLIFLEAYALKRKPPRFAVHLLGDLQEAGAQLGLRALQDYCRKLLGRKQAALTMYSYADVQRANASGKVWLILDGMVLDVGRWLPEHPGGASIIPKQSLDCDCARFFEMYHASKESFLYIEEFYIGELLPADRASVPQGGRQPPSQDFLQQLREFTTWRQAMQQQALAQSQQASMFKSF